MVIDKINSINQVTQNTGVNKIKKTSSRNSLGADSVSISKEAQNAQINAKAVDLVKGTQDVRQERVQDVKAKLARGEYDNIDTQILEKVAEKIAMALLRP